MRHEDLYQKHGWITFTINYIHKQFIAVSSRLHSKACFFFLRTGQTGFFPCLYCCATRTYLAVTEKWLDGFVSCLDLRENTGSLEFFEGHFSIMTGFPFAHSIIRCTLIGLSTSAADRGKGLGFMTCGKWKLWRFVAVSLQGSNSGITGRQELSSIRRWRFVVFESNCAHWMLGVRLSF